MKNIIIIGAGPGGYTCASRAAELGNNVTIIDKDFTPGGTCLNRGCIPSKNLLHVSYEYYKAHFEFKKIGIEADNVTIDYKVVHSQKNKIVADLRSGIEFIFKKNKVKFLSGNAKIIDKNLVQVGSEKLQADAIVIATGSIPHALKGLEFDGNTIISSTEALNLEFAPKKLLVVGGGYIGLEIGSIWKRLGSNVTVIEVMDRIIPGLDKEIGQSLYQELQKQGIEFLLNTSIEKVENNNIYVSNADGKKIITVDKILVAAGRVPNTTDLGTKELGIEITSAGYISVGKNFTTSIDGIYAIGDVIQGPMLAHKAEEEGRALANYLSDVETHIDYNTIPSIVYTHPEVASIGFTEENLIQNNINYLNGKSMFSANGRSKSANETAGFVKILAHKASGIILGSHIIGSHAGNMIGELAIAMRKKMKIDDIINVCHAHPTYSEAIRDAAINLQNKMR